jgi:hypothetical protein
MSRGECRLGDTGDETIRAQRSAQHLVRCRKAKFVASSCG